MVITKTRGWEEEMERCRAEYVMLLIHRMNKTRSAIQNIVLPNEWSLAIFAKKTKA